MSDERIVRKVPLRQISMAENSRQNYDETAMAELMVSMRHTGLLQPIGVQSAGEGKFRMVFGFRRYMAAQKLGWETIDVILTDVLDENDSLIKNSVENIQRSSVSAAEQGRVFSNLLKAGLTTQEISARVGCSLGFVTSALTIFNKIPKQYRDLIDHGIPGKKPKRGTLTASVALNIEGLRKRYALNEDQRDKILAWAADSRATADKVKMVSRFMADHGFSVKEAVARAENIKVYTLHFAINKRRANSLQRKTGIKIADFAYSLLTDSPDLRAIPMRIKKPKIAGRAYNG